MAGVDNIAEAVEGTDIRCKHSINVANIHTVEGESEITSESGISSGGGSGGGGSGGGSGSGSFQADPVDQSCYV